MEAPYEEKTTADNTLDNIADVKAALRTEKTASGMRAKRRPRAPVARDEPSAQIILPEELPPQAPAGTPRPPTPRKRNYRSKSVEDSFTARGAGWSSDSELTPSMEEHQLMRFNAILLKQVLLHY